MRSLVSIAALVFCSVLVSLGCLEVMVRLLDGIPVLSAENFVSRALDTMRVKGGAATYDSALGWVQAPDFSTGSAGNTFTTGEFGARMSSNAVVPLQQHAVLAVGDSFTVGSEVSDNETWPAHLEHFLGTQVINAAVGSYGVDQSVLRAEMLVPILKPKVLLLELVGPVSSYYNGLQVVGGAPKPFFRIEDHQLVLHNSPVPRTATAPSEIGWLRSIFGHSYLVYFVAVRLDKLDWWVASHLRNKLEYGPEEGAKVSCALMERLAELQARENVRVAIVLQYGGTEPLASSPPWDRSSLLDCIRSRGIDVADTFDALHSVYQNDGEVAYKDLWVMHENGRIYGHMSSAGNELVARVIAKHITTEASAAPAH